MGCQSNVKPRKKKWHHKDAKTLCETWRVQVTMEIWFMRTYTEKEIHDGDHPNIWGS